jgi:hypothetical protein
MFGETLVGSLGNFKSSEGWVRRLTAVIPASWEVEIRGLQFKAFNRQKAFKTSLPIPN